MNRQPHFLTAALCVFVLAASGCSRSDLPTPSEITATAVRSARRAYDGAPPVVPHPPQKAACITCHTQTGQQVPNMGFAAANPHQGSRHAGATQNCRQCHVFKTTEASFVASAFEGIPQRISKAPRAFPGAPPMIPHPELMRENCTACHSGPSARPDIRCTHTERTNCRQCHLFQQPTETFPSPDLAQSRNLRG
ncbi:MAG: hypothetical protein R3C49_10230 [Planctomycetaceae bacterium]